MCKAVAVLRSNWVIDRETLSVSAGNELRFSREALARSFLASAAAPC